MGTTEVAAVLGITDRSARNLVGEGRLDAVSCPSGWCIDPSALETLDYRKGKKRSACPVNECCAFATLPEKWVDDIARQYRLSGHMVETGGSGDKCWLRVHGLRQVDLSCHLNDPLGAPGEQDPRNVQTTIKRYRPKVKPLPHDRILIEEEHRYLRPDDD